MKRYGEYKISETAWLGSIPVEWDCKKIGSLFSERKVKVSDKDFAPLSVTKNGIVPQMETVAKSNAGDNRKLVKSGDFVINSRSDRKGSCGVSPLDGSVSLINIVLEPRQEWNERYVHYLLRTTNFSEEYYRYGRGIVADLWTTRYSEMRNIILPIPPRAEQDQIVRYLDWQVSKINRLIAAKKREIAIFKEIIQAEIERQLSLYPVTKEVRLKQLGSFSKGGGFSRENLVDENNDCPAILYGDIYTQYNYETSIITHHIDKDAYDNSRKISKGIMVLSGTGETKDEIGKPILYTGDEVVAVGGDVIVFTPYNGVNCEYILFYLYSQKALAFRYVNGKGDIIVHIYPKSLGDTIIPIISDEKQAEAVESIKAIINKANQTNLKLEKEIDTLHELRNKLISDVVTGQIDVRGVEIPDFEYVEENNTEEEMEDETNE